MSQTTYRVRNWSSVFENAQSRKYQKLGWVPFPNKHDGKSYRRLMSMPDGPALFAAWVLMVQVASKSPTRGVLADEDGPLDADDLAFKTGCPADVFAKAFETLTQPKIGWIESVSLGAHSQHATTPFHFSGLEQNRTSETETETETEGFAKITKPDWPDLDSILGTESPLQDSGFEASSVWEPLKTPEKLRDPQAIHRWHRWQLASQSPVLGPERSWQAVLLALGLKLTMSSQVKNPKGAWIAAICKSRFKQAQAFVPQAIELLKPIWAAADSQGGQP